MIYRNKRDQNLTNLFKRIKLQYTFFKVEKINIYKMGLSRVSVDPTWGTLDFCNLQNKFSFFIFLVFFVGNFLDNSIKKKKNKKNKS